MNKLAKEMKTAITEACMKFGRHSYYDKGAYEVMAVDCWVERLRALTAVEAYAVVKELHKDFKDSEPLLEAVCGELLEDDEKGHDLLELWSELHYPDKTYEELKKEMNGEPEPTTEPKPIEFQMGCVRDTLGK